MIAHLRPILVCFLALALGIWLAKLWHYDSIWYFIVIVSMLSFALLMLLLRLVTKENKFVTYFWNIRKWVCCMLIPIMIGFGAYHIVFSMYSIDFTPKQNIVYGVSGTVDTNYIVKEKGIYFVISNVKVIDSTETISLKRNVFVYLYHPEDREYTKEELEKIKPGNVILMVSTLVATPVFADTKINAFAYSNNFQHSAYTTLDSINVIDGKMGFWDSAREYIRNIYNQYMDERYAGLAFSVLVGDKTSLPEDIAQNFQVSGIAHVVAVSGLNTAFIMLLLLFILNRIKAKRWIKLIVVILILGFYALLCDLAPSVVRASIMSVFLLFGQLFGKQSDSMNSIALSGILLLLLYPLYIFDLSFLLSYAGVFGIFLLYPVFKSWLSRFKYPKITDAIALTLSATIGTLPLIINAFEYVSLIGLIANLILVPLFGFAFMILFGITLLSLIIPFAGYLLTVIQYGFWVVDKGALLFASVPYAITTVKPIREFALVGYYSGIFFSSRYCIANSYLKTLLIQISFTAFIIGFVLSFF